MFSQMIGKWIYGYPIEKDIQKIDERFVAAGDPAYELDGKFVEITLLRNDQRLVDGLDEYEVYGYSMYPCGISNSDHLFVNHQVKVFELKDNDFILVKVDPNDYVEENVFLKHKLRRYLLNVAANESVDDIVARLTSIQPEASLFSYREKLKAKLEKSQNRYGNTIDFSLSYTFKEGELTYSFHPCDYLEGRVQYVYRRLESRLVESTTFCPYR